jgi:hypothetical protein
MTSCSRQKLRLDTDWTITKLKILNINTSRLLITNNGRSHVFIMLQLSTVVYLIIIEKINVCDSLLVDYKHIINNHCIFVGTFEPCNKYMASSIICYQQSTCILDVIFVTLVDTPSSIMRSLIHMFYVLCL